MAKIILDAGHYGKYNHSPAVNEYWESDMTWKLHLKLKKELEKYGIEVDTTRENKETDLDVYYRGKKAKGYDMFISLHSNATGGGVNENCDHPIVIRQNDDTASELWCQDLSNKIAALMITKEKGRTGTRLNSSGGEYYGVLRGSKAAGCNNSYIIEHSFHTATAPSKWLLVDGNLDKLAVAEAELIAKKFGLKKKKDEEEELTESQIREIIKDELSKSTKVYHYWKDLPNWSKQPVYTLYKAGILSGASNSDLNLTDSDVKALVYIYRSYGVDRLPKVSDEEFEKVFS